MAGGDSKFRRVHRLTVASITFDRCDPDTAAESGSAVLIECWEPPCLHYSPEYLRWHLLFPASIPPIAIAAREGSEPIGFIGATPRRIHFDTRVYEIYIVSFVGVRPGWRNRGIAASLYQELLSQPEIRKSPIVTFAEPSSNGESLIKNQYPAAGFSIVAFGVIAGSGCIARSASDSAKFSVSETSDLERLERIWNHSSSNSFIQYAPTADQLGYYLRQSSTRKVLSVVTSQKKDIGAAINTCAEVLTSRGITSAAVLESVTVIEGELDVVAAICGFSASASGCGPVVSLPNPPQCDLDLARRYGFRSSGRLYTGFVASLEVSHPLLHASGTNLEIT